jgi:EF hand
MWRFLTGAAAMLVLVAAGFYLSRQMAESAVPLPAPPVGATGADAPAVGSAPVADPAIREARRFARYDKNKDGLVGTEEYLVTRQKAFARIDTNRDGVLSFAEYSAKATEKFRKADQNRSGGLDSKEFATTRAVRKARPAVNCPPTGQPAKAAEIEGEGDG